MFTVYDTNKIALAEFTDLNSAQKYVYNNNDIAGFINDERVVEIVHVPVDTEPAAPVKVTSSLLTAAEAAEKIKMRQQDTVIEIIEGVIRNSGIATFPRQHKLVTIVLEQLGYGLELLPDGCICVYIKSCQ